MQQNTRGNILYLTGSLLICTIAIVLTIAALGFFGNITIHAWHFPLAFILAAALNCFIAKKFFNNIKAFYSSAVISVAVILISIFIAGSFYDVSYDGQSYHQEGIYQYKNGWNPVKQLLPKSVNMALYINHYGKGVELPQSTIYSLTNRIETAKATNFILLAGVFCVVLSLLLKFNALPVSRSWLLALLITLNPVAVNQLLSTYVDGQLAMMILALLAVTVLIFLDNRLPNLLLLAAVIIILANVKFTGLVYLCIFVAAFLAWLAIMKKWPAFKSTLITAVLSGIVAVIVVGYNPYVINTTQFQHPFYPVMGKQKVDIMSYNTPKAFSGKSGTGKFFTSLFAHTENEIGNNNSAKIPFALAKNDIINAGKVDTRMAGLGPWFSGILLLSFLLLALITVKTRSAGIKNYLFITAALLLSVAIMPESWWARYIPQFWYLPLVILAGSELLAASKFKLLKGAIYLTVIINVAFTFTGLGWNILMTALAKDQIARMKAANQTIVVQWGSAEAIRIRLQENNIPYAVKVLDNTPHTENFAHAEGKFLVPASQLNAPKSKLVQWAQKLNR